MDQAGHRKIGTVEERFIRQESNAGPGVALTALSGNGKIFDLIAILEGHAVHIAIAADRDVEPLGQRVYHRHTYAVQTAAELIVLIREFTAGVQRRENDLYAGLLLLRVQINRHTPPVIGNGNRTIGMHNNINLIRVARQGLVNRVIDNLLGKVVGASSVGIHTGALAHRL